MAGKDYEVKPTPASPHLMDVTENPVEFEIPGQMQFDFSVETHLEIPVDFEVKFRSNFRSD